MEPPAQGGIPTVADHPKLIRKESPMWTKPAFTDLRIGFEVTMYFASR